MWCSHQALGNNQERLCTSLSCSSGVSMACFEQVLLLTANASTTKGKIDLQSAGGQVRT